MKYVKRIFENKVEYKYVTVQYTSVRFRNVTIVVGDTDIDDYEEVIQVTKRFKQKKTKGVFVVGSKCIIFVAYTKFSALLDDFIIPVGNDFSSEWRHRVSVYIGCPALCSPKVVYNFMDDVESGLRSSYVSIAEWLINFADSTVFYLGTNIVVFRFTLSDAYRYEITDKGLTYLAKARLLA